MQRRGPLPNMGDVTPATRVMFSGRRSTGGRRRRRAKSRRSAPRARKARRAPKKRGRLVKGSAAAKRYMASIRRKRRR